jgi:hypothetical protein
MTATPLTDELPEITLSDRLNSANRAEMSRVIRNAVREIYRNNT